MNIGHNSGNGVAVITPDADEGTVFHYISLHIGDWLGGTVGMTPEQEGAYFRFLAHLYQRGKPLPDDDRLMARVMSLSLRVWKRLKSDLVALGKIIIRAGSLTNNRFEKERQKRAEEMRKRSEAAQARWAKSREVSAKFAPSLGETSGKLGANVVEKSNKINDVPIEVDMLSNIQNPISNNTTLLARPAFDRSRESLDALQDKLLSACNGAAANPAACPAILSMSEPIRWIEGGCDLELDVLPTIRERAHRMAPQSVRNWRYFSQAVADAKAAREAPMPEGQARPSGGTGRPLTRSDARAQRAKEHHDYVQNMIADLEKGVANAKA